VFFRGYGWILVAIDVLSRRAYAFALKTKQTQEVAEVFEREIIKKAQIIPHRIWTGNLRVLEVYLRFLDNGKEFTGAPMQRVLKCWRIRHFICTSKIKCGVAERVIRLVY
jgi:hypothetical protein